MRDVDEPTERPAHLPSPELPTTDRAHRIRRLRAVLGAAFVRTVEYIISWRECARSRRQLADRNDHMLQDIGIDRATVEDDRTSSFWRSR